jgi:hypothetical protein
MWEKTNGMRDSKKLANEKAYQKIRFYKHLRVFVFVNIGFIWLNFTGFADIEGLLKANFIWLIFLAIHYTKVFGTDSIQKWMSNDWELDVMRKEYEAEGLEEVPEKFDLAEMKDYYKNNPSKCSDKRKRYSWEERDIV